MFSDIQIFPILQQPHKAGGLTRDPLPPPSTNTSTTVKSKSRLLGILLFVFQKGSIYSEMLREDNCVSSSLSDLSLMTPYINISACYRRGIDILEKCINLELEANDRDTRLPQLSYLTDLLC